MSSLRSCFSVFLSVYARWLLHLIFAPGLIIGGKYSCNTASSWFLNFYLFRYPYNRIPLCLYFSSEFPGKNDTWVAFQTHVWEHMTQWEEQLPRKGCWADNLIKCPQPSTSFLPTYFIQHSCPKSFILIQHVSFLWLHITHWLSISLVWRFGAQFYIRHLQTMICKAEIS